MRQYLKGIAAVLNVILLITAINQIASMTGPLSDGKQLLLLLLVIITPAFTLLTLFAPDRKLQ